MLSKNAGRYVFNSKMFSIFRDLNCCPDFSVYFEKNTNYVLPAVHSSAFGHTHLLKKYFKRCTLSAI